MKWMLRLYPRSWRRRYGEEFLDLVAAQRMSIALVVDVAAGAVDAWLSPQVSETIQPATAGKENNVFAKALTLHCGGGAATLTRADHMKSVVVTITLTLMLTIAWVWVIRQTRGNAYFDTMALGPLAYLAPYLYAMRYTYLKTRSARAQAVFIGGTLGVVAALLLVIGLISART